MRIRALSLVVLAAAACGGGGPSRANDPLSPPSTPGGTNNNPAPQAALVTIRTEADPTGYGVNSFSFSPGSVLVARGGTVTWSNGTSTTHNIVFTGAGAPADVPDHASGSTARVFGTAGTFNYSCQHHSGMNGSVTVQ